jgi:hypothetical protein
MEPATFRLVEQCLNQLRHGVPPLLHCKYVNIIGYTSYIFTPVYINIHTHTHTHTHTKPLIVATYIILVSLFKKTRARQSDGHVFAINCFHTFAATATHCIISTSPGYDPLTSSILDNKTLLVKGCSSGHSCTGGAISRGLQYMTCGNTEDALNLTHAGLPLFLYYIPHPLNVVVSLFLREFHACSTSRPNRDSTWFTYVFPEGKKFLAGKMAEGKHAYRLFCLSMLLLPIWFKHPWPSLLVK